MKNNGFTLIEVIVASAVLALVMAGVYAALHLGIGFGKSERDVELQNHQAAHAALKSHLEAAFVSPDIDDFNFQGSNSSVSFYIMPPEAARPARVEYFLCDGREYRGLCRTINPDPFNPDAPDPAPQPVAGRVTAVTFAYYDGGAWGSSWNAAGALPQKVRIEIESPGLSGEQQVLIPLAQSGIVMETGRK